MQDVELIQIVRNGYVDCVHRGRIAVVDRHGKVIYSAGDIQAMGYLRSIAKPFQAITVIETGAAAHFQLTREELAIASGSHNGTTYHTDIVQRVLAKIGLGADALHCGVLAPLSRRAYEDLLLSGHRPTVLNHNCSGKHTMMLASCVAKGWDIPSYTRIEHPVQQHIYRRVAECADLSPDAVDISPDGCSVPTFGLPLYNVAVMFMQLGVATLDAPNSSLGQIGRVMQEYPLTYSGEKRLDSDMTLITQGRLIAKDGAEAIIGVAVPQHGVGIALKVSDGAQRAIVPALLHVMRKLGYISADEYAQLEVKHPPIVTIHTGEQAAIIQTMLE
jgi:L-asparaginase II